MLKYPLSAGIRYTACFDSLTEDGTSRKIDCFSLSHAGAGKQDLFMLLIAWSL
jgi:hypothetical protein